MLTQHLHDFTNVCAHLRKQGTGMMMFMATMSAHSNDVGDGGGGDNADANGEYGNSDDDNNGDDDEG